MSNDHAGAHSHTWSVRAMGLDTARFWTSFSFMLSLLFGLFV